MVPPGYIDLMLEIKFLNQAWPISFLFLQVNFHNNNIFIHSCHTVTTFESETFSNKASRSKIRVSMNRKREDPVIIIHFSNYKNFLPQRGDAGDGRIKRAPGRHNILLLPLGKTLLLTASTIAKTQPKRSSMAPQWLDDFDIWNFWRRELAISSWAH